MCSSESNSPTDFTFIYEDNDGFEDEIKLKVEKIECDEDPAEKLKTIVCDDDPKEVVETTFLSEDNDGLEDEIDLKVEIIEYGEDPDEGEETIECGDDPKEEVEIIECDADPKEEVETIECDEDSEGQENCRSEDCVLPSISTTNSHITCSSECGMKTIPFTKYNLLSTYYGNNATECMNYFFDNIFFEMFCKETNAQAIQAKLANTVTSNIRTWTTLTVPEARVFLGLIFHMGTISLDYFRDYWRTDRLFSIPIFKQQMSRNRFLAILKCLSFTNAVNYNFNSLFKVMDLTEYFNNKMKECYCPGKDLIVDDCLVLRGGKFMTKKHYQHTVLANDINLYMMTEPDGIVLKFLACRSTYDMEDPESVRTQCVVQDLLTEKLNRGHSVYLGKSYTSFYLAKTLLHNNTLCTGILCDDLKEIPAEVKTTELDIKENISVYKESVHIGKWKDKRGSFSYLSTEFCNKLARRQKDDRIIEKPVLIYHYDAYMSMSNRHDDILSSCPLKDKSLRWDVKIAVLIFHLLLLNSYKLYKKYYCQPKMQFNEYRLLVINDMLPKVRDKPKPANKAGRKDSKGTRNDPATCVVGKFAHKIVERERNEKGRRKRVMCKHCVYKYNKRKDTVFRCDTCVLKPALCLDCFNDYHDDSAQGRNLYEAARNNKKTRCNTVNEQTTK